MYALLLVPEVDTPIDSSLASLFHEDLAAYNEKIRSHVMTYALMPLQAVVKYIMEGKSPQY